MALTRVSGISSNLTIAGVVTVTSLDATSVETNIVQIGSGTTIHTTGIDLGSGNIQSHNIHSSGIITATQFVGDGSLLTGVAGGVGAAFADPDIPSSYGTPGPDGALRYFAAGGGGGTYLSGTTPNQYGGGGRGGARATIGATHNPYQDGITNTGSGGGGLGDNVGGSTGCGTGKGGSGFVCIRYPV